MIVSSLNSLAELGAALNLAFGLVKEIRDYWVVLLRTQIEEVLIEQSDYLETLAVHEKAIGYDIIDELTLKHDKYEEEAHSRLDKKLEFVKKYHFYWAISTVVVMFIYLTVSAVKPAVHIPSFWAPVMLLAILTPTIVSLVHQKIICFQIRFSISLSLKRDENKILAKIKAERIKINNLKIQPLTP